MTDVVARSDSDTPADDPVVIGDEARAQHADDTASGYAWAPAEPVARKRRLGLWIGIPAGAAVVGLVASSLVLIAPGTSVAGVSVGWQTAGVAGDSLAARLASTTVVLGGAGGGAALTGADLSASIDARALTEEAFSQRPMWNVSTWFGEPIDADVTIDAAAAAAALRKAAPALYTAPVDAKVSFDATAASYVAEPAEAGEGVDVARVEAALQKALDTGASTIEIDPVLAPIPAPATTADAEAAVAKLNGMLAAIGFYVGDERTVPVDPAVAASWLSVGEGEDGPFTITADEDAIQTTVDGLAPLIDRAAVPAKVVVNTSGTVLREDATGLDGRTLGDVSHVAEDFAAQLQTGDAVFALPVTQVPFETVTVQRLLEVDLSEQMLYLKDNGVVADSWPISSGAGANATHQGTFRVQWKVDSQTMRGYETRNGERFIDPGWTGPTDSEGYAMYAQPNVKWAMYFNGGEAFHGVYWHNNFGHPMSHGCVGMPEWRAKQLYDWSPTGVDVVIHS